MGTLDNLGYNDFGMYPTKDSYEGVNTQLEDGLQKKHNGFSDPEALKAGLSKTFYEATQDTAEGEREEE